MCGGRMRIQLPAFTDNSGTEAVCNKLFTTVQPLAFFVQRLATVAWQFAVTLDATHVSGCHNDDADWLSRWKGEEPLPSQFRPEYRVDCSLPILWDGVKDVRVFPAGAQLLWEPPLSKECWNCSAFLGATYVRVLVWQVGPHRCAVRFAFPRWCVCLPFSAALCTLKVPAHSALSRNCPCDR